MAAAATARASAAPRTAPLRKPRSTRRAPASKARPRQAQRPRPRQAPGARLVHRKTGRASASPAARPRIMAGAALFPQAAVRGVGAVRDFSDSSLIMRLTRGRGWIGVLGALLVGIVALNVLSLSLSAGSGRLSLQIDELKTEVSALHAQIDERLSASRVQEEAARLGLAVPDPKAITYLSANNGDATRLAHLLATDGFLLAPSVPSSYPANGISYSAPQAGPTAPTSTTTTPPASTTGTTATTTPSSSGSTSGSSSGSAPSSGSTSGSTGGVGL
jgi:hypothetical protein